MCCLAALALQDKIVCGQEIKIQKSSKKKIICEIHTIINIFAYKNI
jgi:hypothetical protein